MCPQLSTGDVIQLNKYLVTFCCGDDALIISGTQGCGRQVACPSEAFL